MDKILKFIVLQFLNIFVFTFALFTFPIKPIFEFFYYKHPDFFRDSKNYNLTKHKERVKLIQAQIQQWNKMGRTGYLSTSQPEWKQTTVRNTDKIRSSHKRIQVDLGDIIEIDTKSKILHVEPRMRMGTLTYKLLALGWTIPVIPEVEDLTVGGLICGAGLETSSHKYGFFCNTCVEYEVVLPNGEVVNCSKKENSDLFETIPMSNGTLGFLTAVKIQMLPVKKYVELSYYSATTLSSAIKLMSNTSHEFVEGIQYAKNKYVITYGDFTDYAPTPKIRTFLNWYDPFFYLDTEMYFGKPPGSISRFVPLRDYYHRHSRGMFWMVPILSPIFLYTTYIFGWLLPFRAPLFMYFLNHLTFFKVSSFSTFLQKFGLFAQDYVVPMDDASKILEILEKEAEVYPIWLCPTKIIPSKGMLRAIDNKESVVLDIGVYGLSKKSLKPDKVFSLWKRLEKETLDVGGLIAFYTDNMLTREEFSQMFNQKLYLEVRKKYGCDDAFPLVYDKIKGTRIQNETKSKIK